MPFDIAIVGAGISGLAAAIGLARDGHTVNVYEHRTDTQQASGSGLQIQPSAVKILDRWGLLEGFANVAHASGKINLTRWQDGTVVARQDRRGERGQWYCLRNALRGYLYEAAVASGAVVHFNTAVTSIDFDAPSITLKDGSVVHADLLVAANGTNSFIRRLMHPGSDRILTDAYVFQANIPKEEMYKEPSTRALYDDASTQVHMGQNSWSFTSAAPNQDIYDMQVVVRNYAESHKDRDPRPQQLLETLENADMMKESVQTWDERYKHVLGKASKGFFKWRVTVAPEIPSALAKSGKVVLIGDAAHAIDPSAGFGTALSLEDGFTLTYLISKARTTVDIPALLAVFDRLMLRRARAIGNYSSFMGQMLSFPDGPMQQMRDRAMRKFDPNSTLGAKGSIKAKFGSPEWQAYMDDYDPVQAVEEALERPANGEALAPGTVASRL